MGTLCPVLATSLSLASDYDKLTKHSLDPTISNHSCHQTYDLVVNIGHLLHPSVYLHYPTPLIGWNTLLQENLNDVLNVRLILYYSNYFECSSQLVMGCMNDPCWGPKLEYLLGYGLCDKSICPPSLFSYTFVLSLGYLYLHTDRLGV